MEHNQTTEVLTVELPESRLTNWKNSKVTGRIKTVNNRDTESRLMNWRDTVIYTTMYILKISPRSIMSELYTIGINSRHFVLNNNRDFTLITDEKILLTGFLIFP